MPSSCRSNWLPSILVDTAKQFRQAYWFREIHSRTGNHSMPAGAHIRSKRGQKDNRSIAQLRIKVDASRYFAPIHVRHHHVEQDQVRVKLTRYRQYPSRDIHGPNVVKQSAFEVEFETSRHCGFVIDNEYPPGTHILLLVRCRLGLFKGRWLGYVLASRESGCVYLG